MDTVVPGVGCAKKTKKSELAEGALCVPEPVKTDFTPSEPRMVVAAVRRSDYGVTADRGCVTVNWKRHERLFEAARVHVRAQLAPNTPEPLSHDQSNLPNPQPIPSLPSPVQ